MDNVTSRNWKAWHDFMPGSEPTLRVAGEVTVPTSGYDAKLTPHYPPGINPTIYLLDLIVTPPAPDQQVSQVVTTLPVRYEEETRNNYSQVTVLPEETTVDVEITS